LVDVGEVPWLEAARVFNLGIGLVLVLPAAAGPAALELLPGSVQIGALIPRAGDDAVLFR
jgi:phosphoribosylformylglycinamidine cyclo-ligase